MADQPQQPSINPGRVLGTFGRLVATDTEADNTNKRASYAGLPFVTAQAPVAAFNINAQAAGNLVEVGGGQPSGQAATRVDFYTAAAVNTPGGTRRWQVDNAGHMAPVLPNANDLGLTGQAVRNGFIDRIADEGPALGLGNFPVSGQWGAGATLAIVGTATDTRGIVDITANGAGIVANPGILISFAGPAWPTPPVCIVKRGDTNAPNAYWAVTTQLANVLAVALVGLPVAGTTYRLLYRVVG